MSARPFAEIFHPVAEEALAGIEVADPIRTGFASYLERRLTAVLAQAVYLAFCAHRISAQGFHGTRKGCYASFVEGAPTHVLGSLLSGFPVAEEALTILVEQTRRFMQDFAAHLAEDRGAITTLLDESPDSTVSQLKVGLSDPHRGGRTVVRVTFASGRQLYYKPRSLAVDAVWAAGLAGVNEWLPLALRAPIVVECGDHGWAEAIPEQRVMTRRAADAYYWRCGAWLGVAWLLDATDFHRENVIISGEHPVLVDMETVLHPFGPGDERSLVRTRILPVEDEVWDESWLGATEGREGPRFAQWRGQGTDDLHLVLEAARIPAATHLPLVEGVLVRPPEAAREVAAGLQAVARAATACRDRVQQWRLALSATPRRQIHRGTTDYVFLLRKLTRPEFLGASEVRARAIAQWQDREPLDSKVCRAEAVSLVAWDIPIFSAPQAPPSDLPWEALAGLGTEWERSLGESVNRVR